MSPITRCPVLPHAMAGAGATMRRAIMRGRMVTAMRALRCGFKTRGNVGPVGGA